ncbi:MAG: SusC/RagA family TonB-linked outer membrane protein [Bacteroidota bacterium]
MKRRTALTKLLLFLFGILVVTTTYAQQRTLTGTVTDATNGDPLPGATVLVKGTTMGTATDMDGHFELRITSGEVLVVSFVGYISAEIPILDKTMLDVALNPSSINVDELVVIGYGTVKKDDATGSVTAISADDFNKGNITSAQDLLVGKTAGVVITSTGGAPGSGSTIRIRGGSSLNASNDPLYVIDGVLIDNHDLSGGNNILSIINPNDIQTFTVLKDASATAIYGARASNGVIIITTKKGKANAPLSVSYNVNASMASPIEFLDVYSGDELRQIAYEHMDIYNIGDYDVLGSANTNWQQELFRTAFSMDHNLSASGSVKATPYRVSLGYTDQNGIMKNTAMNRFTGAFNVSPEFLGGDLKVTLNAKGMRTHNNFGDKNALGSAVNMDPTQSIYDGNPATDGYFQWSSYGANLGTPNPVEQLMGVDDQSNVYRFIGNAQIDYKIPFLENLEAHLNLATDNSSSAGNKLRDKTSPTNLTGDYWGYIGEYSAKMNNQLMDAYLSYSKEFESSHFDITLGHSYQHVYRSDTSYTYGYTDETHPFVDKATIHKSQYFLLSFFGRMNYSIKDKYYLTVTMREDGSSRFSQGTPWGFFPSAALAWKISEESFMQNVSAVTNLKLRAGWGITGQQDIFDNDYPSMATYLMSAEDAYYMIDGQYIPTLRPGTYDPFIKWEETTTQNIGLDFGFARNRITGSIDVYKRVTNDLINTVTIPTMSNFSNRLTTNVGSLDNKGVELSLNLIPLSTKDMSLEIGLNFAYNQNTITKLLLTDDPDYIGVLYGDGMTGNKQVTRVGYPAKSFFVNKQVYDANGNPIEGLYVDLSGDGGVVNGDDADKYIYHNPTPDYVMGFSLRFNYKNFDLSASSRANIGNYVYNQLAAGASYDQMNQIGYWKNFPKYLSETNFVKRQFTSDYFVENASFFKVDYISAGYLVSKVADSFDLRVSLNLQNALTITKYSGLDPEVDGGIDNNFYPRPRTFTLGLGITF